MQCSSLKNGVSRSSHVRTEPLAAPAAAGPLTKREQIAAMCLQGILSNKSLGRLTLWSTTRSAVMYADQLLQCLSQDPGAAEEMNAGCLPAATLAFTGVRDFPFDGDSDNHQ